MSSLKPVIHGRDHLPGGADPIPLTRIVAAVLNTEEEHLYQTTQTIATHVADSVSWSRYDGGTFLDLTDPTKAAVTTSGLYLATANATITISGGGATGDSVDFSLGAVQFAGPAWPPSTGGGFSATFTNPNDGIGDIAVAGHVSAIMRIDGGSPDYIGLSIYNRTGADINVENAGMNVVKVFDLP